MSNAHTWSVGDVVKARPRLVVPRDPNNHRRLTWPWFYPGRITALVGSDGVMVEFYPPRQRHSGLVTPWVSPQGLSYTDLHALDCRCGSCSDDNHPDTGSASVWPSSDEPDCSHSSLRKPASTSDSHTQARDRSSLNEPPFIGTVQIVAPTQLRQGDVLLFPHQHVHLWEHTNTVISVITCHGVVHLETGEHRVVFRPDKPAPVCNTAHASYDPRFAPGSDGELSNVETVVAERLLETTTRESQRQHRHSPTTPIS
ncbi:hypothetical protein [Haloglycomyces albus]|uniref:hypothetical protein n=1 Tax=Haloglycomyces albus TaxID=526067 RepID=UPI00046CEFEE|nr:hypothetical protein [Haloglycomyces albus]